MTTKEVARAYREYPLDDGHFADVMVAINNNYNLDDVAKELSKLYKDEE